jgi:hypothetical protein
MECPVCSTVLPDGLATCTKCKADLSRWHPKQEKIASTPAVILEKRYVFTFSAFKEILAPFVLPLIFLVLFCAAAYGGYRIYVAHILNSAIDTTSTDAQSPAPAAASEVLLSTTGFDRLFQAYTASAAALNFPALENKAADSFQSGTEAIEAINFDDMEAAGITVIEESFTKEEKKKAAKENFTAKCAGAGNMEYLNSLPSDATGYTSCWIRKSSQTFQWAQAQWLPELRRWSPWTAEQLLIGADKYVEMMFGQNAMGEDQIKTKTLPGKTLKAGSDPTTGATALFETYRTGFQREGALAALEQMRTIIGKKTTPAP